MSGPPKDPHRTADTPVLSARGLYAGYGDMDVLHDVNFTVGRGEVVGIFGLNGAGKTTFVSALAGLIPIRRGSLHILRQDHTFHYQGARARGCFPRAAEPGALRSHDRPGEPGARCRGPS